MFEPTLTQLLVILGVNIAGTALTILFTCTQLAAKWGTNELAERELRERNDIRLNDRKERDSIRTNFDLQWGRMPKMQTNELIAFSSAAAAEIRKRQGAATIDQQQEEDMIAQIKNRQNELRTYNFKGYGGQSKEEVKELGATIAQQR